MKGLSGDLRFAFRQLVEKPGFAAAAVLTLALGIGANTAVFSVLSGYLLKPLPYSHHGLAKINVALPKLASGVLPVSLPMQQIVDKNSDAFTATAMYSGDDYNLKVGDRAQDVYAYMTSSSIFQVLGAHPLYGRAFTAADMRAGRNHVAVISYKLWRTSFGSNPDAVGRTVKFDGKMTQVIGVMPKGFSFPDRRADMWLPMAVDPNDFNPTQFLTLRAGVIGWLKPGVSVDAAERRVRQAVQTWLRTHLPYKTDRGHLIDKEWLQNYGFRMRVQPYREELLGDRPTTLWLLQGAVLLILLITCVNVANLLLSRILGRSHEIAMRSALGASRTTLARQLLGETLCLTVPGGLAGIALALLALHFLAGSALGGGNSIFNIALDWRVGLFAFATALLTAILVSLLPIRHLTQTDLQLVFQEGDRTSGGGKAAKRTRNVLVIAELTLATGLLGLAGLLLHSFMNIEAVNPGYRTDHILIAHLTVTPNDFSSTEAMSNVYKNVVRRIDALPGVRQAAIADFMPLMGYAYNMSFSIPGRHQSGRSPAGMINRITAGYFKTLGIPILRGRHFDESDDGRTRAIIDAAVAEKYFHNSNPIGQQIKWRDKNWTIVGVAPSIKYSDLSRSKPFMAVYVNLDQSPSSDMYLMIHTDLPPSALVKPVQNLMASAAPNVAVNGIHTLREQVTDLLRNKQTTMVLLLAFGGIALALSVIGVYAVLSYAIGQRRSEFAVRIALGAVPDRLQALVIRDGLKLLLVGLAAGLTLAVIFGHVLASLLFHVSPYDPLTLGITVGVLAITTLLACYLPARRASKLNPAEAIYEQ